MGVTAFHMEIDGVHEKSYAYIVPKMGYPLILGNPWKATNNVRTAPNLGRFQIGRTRRWVDQWTKGPPNWLLRRIRRIESGKRALETFSGDDLAESDDIHLAAVRSTDIEKALKVKEPMTPDEVRRKLPPEFHDLLALFMKREAEKLAPHWAGVDHEINLKDSVAGGPEALPWGPLYGMSREELLVLKKTLHDLTEKGYIRPSQSSAGAPVLFVRKPGGGLRFCCDYRALNALTKDDRYPLPLISETLRNLADCTWLTKVDVVSAFHKIRVARGHEHKTAFQTRYGLFELMEGDSVWIIRGSGYFPTVYQHGAEGTPRRLRVSIHGRRPNLHEGFQRRTSKKGSYRIGKAGLRRITSGPRQMRIREKIH